MSSSVFRSRSVLFVARLAVCGLLLTVTQAMAQVTTTATNTNTPVFSGSNLTAYPPNIALGMGGPMMMLVASKDHTLFSPIYTDFEDVDGDGVLDHTFKPTFRYYGYFDPAKCYAYNASPRSATRGATAPHARFEPKEATQSGTFKCAKEGSYWSGNFLNWATMTRIDVVRKLLYGGFRRDDTDMDTTLEMAQLSQDAHSFVKYYAGADIGWFTPFKLGDLDNQGLTICNRGSQNSDPTTGSPGAPNMRIAKGNYSLWATIATSEVCRWDSASGPKQFGDKAVAFLAQYGTDEAGVRTPAAQKHKASLPRAQSINGVGPEFDIRVQACPQDDTLNGGRGTERCTAYVSTSGNTVKVVYKPTGLLQKFGTSSSVSQAARAEFGLLTGSYDQPLNGGLLRKNMGSLNDEVNLGNGRFCYLDASVCPGIGATQGIIASFDSFRLYGTGNYDSHARPFALPEALTNDMFPSWGNPISEMVVQALSYLAGHEVSTTAPGGAIDAQIGLPLVAGKDPLDNNSLDAASGTLKRSALYGNGICRAANLLAISSGVASFDSLDSLDTEHKNGDTYAKFTAMQNPKGAESSLVDWTDRVGALEGINGTARSVGSTSGGFGADCTAKDLGGLSALAGICPEAPSVKGGYLGAGATFFANTTSVRTDNSLTEATGSLVKKDNLPTYALRVKSYAASLAGGVARVEVPIPGAYTDGKFKYSKRTVVITPESFWQHPEVNGKKLNVGAMLTFRAIGREAPFSRMKADASGKSVVDITFGGSGSYVVTWNDTQFGGDYDMDIVGFIRWELLRIPGTTTQWALHVYTDILNVDAGDPGSHGFSIIGTDAAVADSTAYAVDGRYITHSSSDMADASVMCGSYDDVATGTDFSQRYRYSLRCKFANTVDDDGQEPWPASVGGGDGNVGFIENISLPDTPPYSSTADTVFKVTATSQRTDVSLRDPLWYMAKYGSFDTKESFGTSWDSRSATTAAPDAIKGSSNLNWDQEHNDGSLCDAGGSCADGEPDGYFLARRPELLENRLTSLFERVANQSNTAVAASATQLVSGSFKYIAKFTQSDDNRYGDLLAYKLKSDGQFDVAVAWSGAHTLSAVSGRDVADKTNSDMRTVITNDRDASGRNVGTAFNTAVTGTAVTTPLSNAYLAALTGLTTSTVTPANAQDLIAYVRGSDAKEGKAFRARPADQVMGPIVSSAPWVQDPATSARFTAGEFPSAVQSYLSFVSDRVAHNNKAIWVGSHDGMLHGFQALTGEPLMSYLPSPVVDRLRSVVAVGAASTSVPLVDGSPFTADLLAGPFTADTPWRTYLFGTLGRGGKAVFALDVSDTRKDAGTISTSVATGDTSLKEGNAARIFKWMFTDKDGSADANGVKDGADLGYSISSPVVHSASGQAHQVVHLNNGKFGVLVPNGYQSARGHAALFILFAEGPGATGWVAGTHYKKLVLRDTDANNGLMGVTWVDLDNNGTADVVYGTDMLGNVWKYDIRDADPANWGSAFVSGNTAVPFFSATGCASASVTSGAASSSCAAQAVAITTNPVATLPSFGGVMLSFGTGKAIEAGDFPNATVRNRYVSVWDKGRYAGDVVFPPSGSGAALPVMGSSFLEIYLARDTATGNVYRLSGSTASAVAETSTADGFNPASNAGWFFNFPSSGEQLISSPVARRSFISFTSVRPLSDDDRATSCSTSPRGTLYAIDPSTGQAIRGLLGSTTLTTNGTSITTTNYGLDTGDQQITSVGDRVASTGTGAAAACGPGKIKARFLGEQTDAAGCVDALNLRLQWREIPGLRTLQ